MDKKTVDTSHVCEDFTYLNMDEQITNPNQRLDMGKTAGRCVAGEDRR
jgi:hypothetical protein